MPRDSKVYLDDVLQKLSPDGASARQLLVRGAQLDDPSGKSSPPHLRRHASAGSVFLSRLADYGVDTFRMTAEDLEKEARLA